MTRSLAAARLASAFDPRHTGSPKPEWARMASPCGGRYSLIADLGDLVRRFEFDGDWLAFESSYNIAPTQEVLTVVGG